MSEQRRQYRTVPVYEGQISIGVARSEECGVRGRVVDLSVGGAAIIVDAKSDPKLDEGEDIYLYIESPYLDEPLVTLGRVQRRNKRDGETHYGLKIVDWLGLLTRLPAELKALFNQRSEYRVGVGSNHPIEVEGISRSFRVDGLLHDLTPHGLCFQVPMDAQGTFKLGHVVRVTFALPDEEEELSFSARIRHTQWAGGKLYCGVCFEKDDSEDESEDESDDIFEESSKDESRDDSKDDSEEDSEEDSDDDSFRARKKKVADYVKEVVRRARDVSSR